MAKALKLPKKINGFRLPNVAAGTGSRYQSDRPARWAATEALRSGLHALIGIS